MSGIDFVEDPNEGRKRDNTVTSSGIEYTNPEIDMPATEPKKPKRSLFGWFRKKPSQSSVKNDDAAETEATEFAPKAVSKKPKRKRKRGKRVQASETESVAPDAPSQGALAPEMPTNDAGNTAATSAPVVQPAQPVSELPPQKTSPVDNRAKDSSEPTAAAPVQASAPAAQEVMQEPSQQADAPEQQPAVQPAAPAMASAPASLGQELGKATDNNTGQLLQPAEKPGDVHAPELAELSGELTDPTEMGEASFAINLLPSQNNTQRRTKVSPLGLLLRTFTWVMVVSIALYAAVSGYRAYVLLQTRTVLTESSEIETEIRSYSMLQREINETNQRVEDVADIVANRVYWSNVFDVLESYTLPNVQYTSISGNRDGIVTLLALTTDFTSVSQQAQIFNNAPDVFASVSVASASAVQLGEATEEDEAAASTITFSVTLTLQPEVLHYQSTRPLP